MTVLHVVEPGFTSYFEERRRADALTVLEEWKAALPEAERQGVTVNVTVGDPFATIIDEAANDGMQLIIVGQPRKTGLKDLFLGTTAERVVRFGDQPVLMVNQHPNGGYRRVLVALDFSEAGRRALEWACHNRTRRRSAHRSRVAVATRQLLKSRRRRPGSSKRAAAAPGGAAVEGPCDADGSARQTVAHRNHRAQPGTAIRIGIGAFEAQLLALGTHSRSRRRTLMVGSLAQEFLAEGACDVLVARA